MVYTKKWYKNKKNTKTDIFCPKGVDSTPKRDYIIGTF